MGHSLACNRREVQDWENENNNVPFPEWVVIS